MGRTACTEPQCLYKGDLYLYLYKGWKKLRTVTILESKKKSSEMSYMCTGMINRAKDEFLLLATANSSPSPINRLHN